jgi:hypothetical protein
MRAVFRPDFRWHQVFSPLTHQARHVNDPEIQIVPRVPFRRATIIRQYAKVPDACRLSRTLLNTSNVPSLPFSSYVRCRGLIHRKLPYTEQASLYRRAFADSQFALLVERYETWLKQVVKVKVNDRRSRRDWNQRLQQLVTAISRRRSSGGASTRPWRSES